MAGLGDLAFSSVLKALGGILRAHHVKRTGQTFARQSTDCWQVIHVQKSRSSSAQEKDFTINFGICPKAVLQFSRKSLEKPPAYYTCPMRLRIGWLMEGQNDTWWRICDGASADSAVTEIAPVLQAKAIPFLNSVQTNEGVLALYSSGLILGSEIDRDEVRLLLAARAGDSERVDDLLKKYEVRWGMTAVEQRASLFCHRFREAFLPGA